MFLLSPNQIPGLKEDYKSLNLHINIAELIMEGSGAPDFRKRWQTERAVLEGEDCSEVLSEPPTVSART